MVDNTNYSLSKEICKEEMGNYKSIISRVCPFNRDFIFSGLAGSTSQLQVCVMIFWSLTTAQYTSNKRRHFYCRWKCTAFNPPPISAGAVSVIYDLFSKIMEHFPIRYPSGALWGSISIKGYKSFHFTPQFDQNKLSQKSIYLGSTILVKENSSSETIVTVLSFILGFWKITG